MSAALATKQSLIQDPSLTIARTSGLQAALDEKARGSDLTTLATASALTTGLASKQNVVTDNALEIRHTRLLQDTLDAKRGLLGDVPGTGVSLRLVGNLRKMYGHGNISIEHTVNTENLTDPTNLQIRVSGALLQPMITAAALLSQSFVSGLADALGAKQNTMTDDSLEVRHVRLLRDTLDSKQSLLSDVQGPGISLLFGTKLRSATGASP